MGSFDNNTSTVFRLRIKACAAGLRWRNLQDLRKVLSPLSLSLQNNVSQVYQYQLLAMKNGQRDGVKVICSNMHHIIVIDRFYSFWAVVVMSFLWRVMRLLLLLLLLLVVTLVETYFICHVSYNILLKWRTHHRCKPLRTVHCGAQPREWLFRLTVWTFLSPFELNIIKVYTLLLATAYPTYRLLIL